MNDSPFKTIGALTDRMLDDMRLNAVLKNQSVGAWRLADGREVLHLGNALHLWNPHGRTVEMTLDDLSLIARIRRHDITAEINALLNATGYPGVWKVSFGASAGTECTPVDVRLDGKRLGPNGWGLLQSQGYALPPPVGVLGIRAG